MPPSRKPPRTPQTWTLENPPERTPYVNTPAPKNLCKKQEETQPGGSHLTSSGSILRARLQQQEGSLPGSSSSEVLQYDEFQSLTTGHNKPSFPHILVGINPCPKLRQMLRPF